MLAPYFILFFLFTVLPVLTSIALSFTYFNMLEWPTFNGWNNYIKLFLEDDIFLVSLKNTLIFAVVTGPISYLLCLLFAWIINEFNSKLRTFLTLIFYAPSICGNAYMVWSLILSRDRYGYLNGILIKLGVINDQNLWMQDANYILPCLIVVQLWLSLGFEFSCLCNLSARKESGRCACPVASSTAGKSSTAPVCGARMEAGVSHSGSLVCSVVVQRGVQSRNPGPRVHCGQG